jgi:hypothetical protein
MTAPAAALPRSAPAPAGAAPVGTAPAGTAPAGTAPAGTAPVGPGLPRWSCRPAAEADRDEILALFTEPDFYYRTDQPATRPEWEIWDLLGDDTRLLLADGRLAGLFAVEAAGPPHVCHYLLHLRLRAAAPLAWWASAGAEVIRAARWRREVIRLAIRFPEFDSRGLAAAQAIGLTVEGTLPGVTVHDGQRQGRVFFARTWEPAP